MKRKHPGEDKMERMSTKKRDDKDVRKMDKMSVSKKSCYKKTGKK